MLDDFQLTPYEAKVLPEGKRLTSFEELVGHTIKYVCEAPMGHAGRGLGAVFITETLCWLPVQVHDNGFDSEPSLSVYTFSQELLLSDFMTAYELHAAGLLTDAQRDHMQVQEREREAEKNRRHRLHICATRLQNWRLAMSDQATAPEEPNGTVHYMRMARADDKDMEVGYAIMSILGAIDKDEYPSSAEDSPYWFDGDDLEHLQFLHSSLKKAMNEAPGCLGRIMGGLSVFLNPKNNIVDFGDDCIELSPRLKEAIKAKEELEKYQEYMRTHVAESLTKLVAQRDQLQAENERLRELLSDKAVDPGMLGLLAVLVKIVTETMDFPPVKPLSADSWLHRDLVSEAQSAITAVRGYPVPTHPTYRPAE